MPTGSWLKAFQSKSRQLSGLDVDLKTFQSKSERFYEFSLPRGLCGKRRSLPIGLTFDSLGNHNFRPWECRLAPQSAGLAARPPSQKTQGKSSCQCSHLPSLVAPPPLCVLASTAAASRWSGRCSSARRTCLASARGSTRSCASVAWTTERRPLTAIPKSVRLPAGQHCIFQGGGAWWLDSQVASRLWPSEAGQRPEADQLTCEGTTDVASYWPTKRAGTRHSSKCRVFSSWTSRAAPARTHRRFSSAWTNGTELTSQLEWPYLQLGPFFFLVLFF